MRAAIASEFDDRDSVVADARRSCQFPAEITTRTEPLHPDVEAVRDLLVDVRVRRIKEAAAAAIDAEPPKGDESSKALA